MSHTVVVPVGGAPSALRRLAMASAAALVVAGLLAPAVAGTVERGKAWLDPAPHRRATVEPTSGTASVIVQATAGRAAEAEKAVEAAGGRVDDRLPLIEGFEAAIPAAAVQKLAESPGIRAISANHRVTFEDYTYDSTSSASNFARTTGATQAWAQNNLGEGVGVAVIDTGISQMKDFAGRVVHGPDLSGEGTLVDTYGHGTAMAGLIGGSGADSAGRTGGAYTGVAPKSTLVAVKVAGRNGAADVSTMLQAMHWVSAYKDQFNIRVLNLSWGTPSTQDPSVDPLNYAVQRLWKQGIVVVVAAGNSGPNSGTVRKPGDDPVILTVGAYDDKQNADPGDDSVTSWSSRGPTAQGLAKPDVVAPGRTLVGARSFGSHVETENPKALISPSYIRGSGTSQAAAVTSGLVALLLKARPDLSPDQVKAILMGTASPIAAAPGGSQGKGRLQLGAALTAATPTSTQTLTSSGLGSIEASRGGWNVEADCGNDGTLNVIKGEIDVRCEAWNGSAWTGSAWTGSAWTGSAWTGGTWTGSAWTGSAWTGSAWTGSAWTGSAWTGSAWTGSAWTGSAWTTGSYDEDLFLNAFWGPIPPPGVYLPGELYTPLNSTKIVGRVR
jgi:serine protease AprX